MTVDKYYKNLVASFSEICNRSCEGDLSRLGRSHSAIETYSVWLNILSERPELTIYKVALREYQIAILAGTIGLYNLAFTGLRFFLERTLTGILFSAKEIDLRLWFAGQRDSYWSEILNEETGVFSIQFCTAFFPELNAEVKHYKAITQKVYRECSEFVHGNIITQNRIPDRIQFSEHLFEEFHNKANIIRGIVDFTYCLRYLLTIDPARRRTIEAAILENVRHITPIRLVFETEQTS